MICWHEDRHLGQWNGIESAEINLYIYGQLIFNEGAKNTMGRGWSFKKMMLGMLYIHRQKHDPRFYLAPYKKMTQNGSQQGGQVQSLICDPTAKTNKRKYSSDSQPWPHT